MKIRNSEIRSFLVLLLVSVSVTLTWFETINIAQAQFGNFIYQQTAEPFLAQAPTIPHALAKGATKNLLKK